MLNFNVRSLRNIINELRWLVQTETIDVIAVTESFTDTISNDLSSEYSIDGF